MKIEPPKNNQSSIKDSSNYRSENNLRNSLTQTQIQPDAPAPTTGAFAKILDETRKQIGKDKDFTSSSKTDSTDDVNKSSDSDTDVQEEKAVKNQDELEEKSGGDSEGGDSESDDNQTAFLSSLIQQSHIKASSENSLPAARSILHVADLERIVSTIRTQNLQNEQQVMIALKHSVLEGLQIRLSVDESGKLKAEFLALNEHIKKQIDARKNELSEIFKQRSINFSEINVNVQSEFAISEGKIEKDAEALKQNANRI